MNKPRTTEQKNAIKVLRSLVGGRETDHERRCTGNSDTCRVDACMVCAIRDCPGDEPLHYHDGCPYCDQAEEDDPCSPSNG